MTMTGELAGKRSYGESLAQTGAHSADTDHTNPAGSQSSAAARPRASVTGAAGSWRRLFAARLCLLLLACLVFGDAFAQRAFAPQYRESLTGDIVVIGNMNLHCAPGVPGLNGENCASAQNGTNGTFNNNTYTMVYSDVDADPSTFNSSRATLNLPPGSTVEFAGLYWGARSSAPDRRFVRWQTPGSPSSVPLEADRVDTLDVGSLTNVYQAFENVTNAVRTAGNGVYTISNLRVDQGPPGNQETAGNYGGWSLVVAYSNPALPLRNLNVFDGLLSAGEFSSTPLDINVDGLLTPPSGTVDTTIGIVVYDGDKGAEDIGFEFGANAGSLTPISNAVNPVNDFWNSTISQNGAHVTTGRTPAFINTLGLDIDLHDTTVLPPGTSTALLRVGGEVGEGIVPGVITLAIDAVVPDVDPVKTSIDVNGGALLPGDEIEYVISGTNTGDDNAADVVFTDVIPANATYVPGSLFIVSGANPGQKTDSPGNDQAEFDSTNNRVIFWLGTGSNPAGQTGGTLAPDESFTIRFRARVNANTLGDTQIVNTGRLRFLQPVLGTVITTDTNPTVNTVAGPDVTINKSHVDPFTAGGSGDYTITASNLGPAPTFGNVTVTDTLPAGLTATAISGTGWTCTLSPLQCTRSDVLAAGAAYPPITLTVSVAAGATGPLVNTVTVATASELQRVTGNNTDTDSTQIEALLIDAVDDAGSVGGINGGVAVANVLINDTLDNAPFARPAVILTFVSGDPELSLDTATGAVSVAAGTAAGTYTLVYQICETANPTNCDTATVTVTVTSATIDAVDDSGTVDGLTGGVAVPNVLVNDTLNGAPVVPADITLTFVSGDPQLSLDTATGAVSAAANTPEGTYTLIYQICENLNPTNCDTATVTVIVGAPEIDAVDDNGTAEGHVGGIAVTNVLVNDTLNNAPFARPAVILTFVSGDPQLSLDTATGAVSVAAGTAAGIYTLFYQICDNLNPTTNCDTATVTVIVTSREIDAVDDSGTADGVTGGIAVTDVRDNDTLGGVPVVDNEVTIAFVSGDPQLSLDTTTGAVSVAAGTAPGTYTLQYRLCEVIVPGTGSDNCDIATVTVVVTAELTLRLSKTATPQFVRIGDLVRYTLTIENSNNVDVVGATLVDTPPAGFTYVDGSLQVFDADGAGGLAGVNPLRVTGIDIAAGGRATVVYLLRVGAGINRGRHTNYAQMFLGGQPASNQAQASVFSGSDPDFEQALLLGSVFHDADDNGIQEGADEQGIPGVRLATVEGLIVETDAKGRFHLEGIDVEHIGRGRNFIVKVDTATLPPGSTFTTRNPLVKRITQGLPARFDFGVKLPPGLIEGGTQQAEMRIGEVLFAPGSAEITPQYLPAVEAMATKVREYGGGEVVITADGESETLAMDRALAVRKSMESMLTAEQLQTLQISVRTDVNAPDSLVVGLAEWPLLGTVLFDTDRATIKPQYRPLIARIATALEQMHSSRIVITGHADKRASDEYNIALGMRRAQAVYDAIVEHIRPELRKTFRVDLSNDPAAPAGNTEK